MILDQLKSKVVEYYKSKDTLRLSVLRFYLSKVNEKEIELRPSNQKVDDDIAYNVLKKRIKETNKSIELYKKGNRQDLVDQETQELNILNEFAKMFPQHTQQ